MSVKLGDTNFWQEDVPGPIDCVKRRRFCTVIGDAPWVYYWNAAQGHFVTLRAATDEDIERAGVVLDRNAALALAEDHRKGVQVLKEVVL
jgi:hypothetical protein